MDICEDENDAAKLAEVFESIERRSGKLVAALVAAVVRRIRDNGEEGTTDIAVDGSTIRLNRYILEEFKKELDSLLADPDMYRLVMHDDDTIIGSAAAAFLG
jgi:hexokinase